MTTNTDLKRLAEEATPGPWVLQDGCSWRRIGTREHDGNVLCPTKANDGHPDLCAGRGEDVYANLRFICAANPQKVLEILAENEAKDAEIERLRSAAAMACDLLAERTYGSQARSPGHNARLVLEGALRPEES